MAWAMTGGSIKVRGSSIRFQNRHLLALLVFLLILLMISLVNNFQLDTEILDDDSISELEADDPRLLEHLRQHYIITPVRVVFL